MHTSNQKSHRLLYSNLVLFIAIGLMVFTLVATWGTQCARAASGSCGVGDSEVFDGDITIKSGTTFGTVIGHSNTSVHTFNLPDTDLVKGMIWAGSAAGQFGALAVGSNDEVLVADSGEATGVKWGTFVSDTTFLDKTSDETVNNSAALQNDNDLTFSVTANKNYAVWGVLLIDSGATPDFKFQWNLPASATIDGTTDDNNGGFSKFTEAASTFIDTNSAAPQNVAFSAILKVEGTGGTGVLQWAQNTANVSDTKLLEGTWLAYRQLN